MHYSTRTKSIFFGVLLIALGVLTAITIVIIGFSASDTDVVLFLAPIPIAMVGVGSHLISLAKHQQHHHHRRHY